MSTKTCGACGTHIAEANAFCTSCGAYLFPPVSENKPGVIPAPFPVTEDILAWNRKIPLITNPYLVLQCIAIPLGIALVMGTFLSLITGEWDLLLLFLIISAGLSVLMVIITLVLHIATGGGLDTEFFVSSEGVAYKEREK